MLRSSSRIGEQVGGTSALGSRVRSSEPKVGLGARAGRPPEKSRAIAAFGGLDLSAGSPRPPSAGAKGRVDHGPEPPGGNGPAFPSLVSWCWWAGHPVHAGQAPDCLGVAGRQEFSPPRRVSQRPSFARAAGKRASPSDLGPFQDQVRMGAVSIPPQVK